VPAIAAALRLTEPTVRRWLKRFNAHGLEGLRDQPRAGRPPTYPPEVVSAVIALSLTDPQSLDLPFASWTLDRLAAYLNEAKGIAMKRTRIDELLLAEGLRWRSQETWFGERVDPAFAEKRHLSVSRKRRASFGRRAIAGGRRDRRAAASGSAAPLFRSGLRPVCGDSTRAPRGDRGPGRWP
jgi:transposase